MLFDLINSFLKNGINNSNNNNNNNNNKNNFYNSLEDDDYLLNNQTTKVSLYLYFFIFAFMFLVVDLIMLYYKHRENIESRETDLSLKLNKMLIDFENDNKIKSSPTTSTTTTTITPTTTSSSQLRQPSTPKTTTKTINSPPSTPKSPPPLPSLESKLLYKDDIKQQLSLNEAKSQIDSAKQLDESLKYNSCIKLYIDGIEKLMALFSSYNSKEYRDYIDFYLKRAEYLKNELKKGTNLKSITNFNNFSKEYQINYNNKILEQQQQQQQQSSSTYRNSLNLSSSKSNSTINNRHSISSLSSLNSTTATTTTPSNTSTITSPGNKYGLQKSLSSTTLSLKKSSNSTNFQQPSPPSMVIPDIKGIDKSMVTLIMNEIMDRKNPVKWDDVVGLDKVKQSLMESVILPNLRPDVFTGLRAPPKGLLLFGPPGNGKTMIAKAVAYESKVTFFSISSSSLTSKYVGDGEKLVRALFAVATHFQPSIIFIDEIDSLLTERSSNESEASRRLKTEILVQFDGARTNGDERVLVMGATNRPEDLDDAALRRLVKRIYVGLPELETRLQIIQHLLVGQRHSLTKQQINSLAEVTQGYSGFDLAALCKDAAYEPIRRLGIGIKDLELNEISLISFKDFANSLKQIRPSVTSQSLKSFEKWNQKFGTI
ncbi:AAA ATPase domain-containing protein [Dictyostelium discoideum AX4]|uniref:Spastin n=1 Tax=Dictyostelium discoideum TaxID=44689 RepID=SPAST_DICDI|nr:AAA ATPase domain-containing protein [Dictyostelium discoideum AX4]Q54KQ7.1 RecName: Full=Spastin [Dictyostelium discoideum]EAL63857.1 AAA ATPase domain-containing protein [Dictyostelium discoideum AX4]|eukprot:XP_637373.1 AAA ATPase domain-containing protein [Dictyostelium discoideum AX4]